MKPSLFASVLVYGAAAFVTLVSLFPFVYVVMTSLKVGNAIFEPTLIPNAPSLQNFIGLFSGKQAFGAQLWNSILVATLSVAFSLLLSLTAAFALGRIQFRGKGLLLTAILGISMFPQIAILSGMFELIQSLGLYNKTLGLLVPYTVFTLPFTVWVLTTFMRDLPTELEEAAIVDGCGPLRTIFQIFVPMLWPAMVSTGLLAFIGAWNEFLFALTFLVEDSKRTVPVGMSMIAGESAFELPWGSIMAASVIVTAPLLALVLLFQKKIVSGLTAGAVKG